MAIRLDALKPDNRALLFRALCDRVRADATLPQVLKTLRVMDGSQGDQFPPTQDQCPWARISPADGGTSPETVGQSSSGMLIRVEVAVSGTRAEDVINLWGAFESCFFPGDGSMLALAQSYGCHALKLKAPAFGMFPDSEARMQVATAYLACEFLVKTGL